MRRTIFIAALIVAFAPADMTGRAFAQGAAPSAAPAPLPKADDSKPLSEKLKEGEGVLKPPPVHDKEIRIPTPPMSGNNMPVIVPPGEPGGDQSIQPK